LIARSQDFFLEGLRDGAFQRCQTRLGRVGRSRQIETALAAKFRRRGNGLGAVGAGAFKRLTAILAELAVARIFKRAIRALDAHGVFPPSLTIEPKTGLPDYFINPRYWQVQSLFNFCSTPGAIEKPPRDKAARRIESIKRYRFPISVTANG